MSYEGEPEIEEEPGDLNRQIQQVIASGDRAVAIGGSVSDSTIVTGDGNVVDNNNLVQRGKYNLSIDSAQGLQIGDRYGAGDRSDDWENDNSDA